MTLSTALQTPYMTLTSPSLISTGSSFFKKISYPTVFTDVAKKISHITSGVTKLVKRVVETIKNYPLQVATFSGSVILGHSLVSGDTAVILAGVIAVINTVCMSKNLILFANSTTFTHSQKSNKIIQRICTVAIVAICVYSISSIPIAEAQGSNNSKYCDKSSSKALEPAIVCLKKGNDLKTCFEQVIKAGFTKNAYEITLHHSGAISRVEIDSKKICYLTSLKTDPDAMKICFDDLKYPQDRSVEVLPDANLVSGFEDMPSGYTAKYVTVIGASQCGTFHDGNAPTLTSDNPIMCIITPGKQNGSAMQTCLNPNKPSQVTVKSLQNFYLPSQGEGPISMITTNPESIGLNPFIEEPYCCNDSSKEY